MLSETRYNDLVDEVLLQVEECLEDCDADLEIEPGQGMLTVEFANGSRVILSRQPPVRQLWVAAKSGGFHFNYSEDDGHWLEQRDGRELMQVLSRVCSEQAGQAIELG